MTKDQRSNIKETRFASEIIHEIFLLLHICSDASFSLSEVIQPKSKLN